VAAAAEEPRGLGALRAIGRRLTDASRGEGLLGGPPPRAPRAERRRRPTGRPKEWLGVVSPDAVRLLLFTGKGGVGKTTCAATAALALADQAPARKILLLSTDPAHSLGDVLAVPLGDPARGLPDVSGGLRARELDADREFRRRQARYREAVDQLFAAVRRGTGFDAAFDRAVVQDLMELAPPGIDELLAMLSVTEALVPRDGGAAAYDMVVVDTAPTGHALRLLALPRMALEWVRALLAILLKYRAVIRPGALAQDLVEMSRDLRQLDALLRDGGATRVVVVTHAAALPRLETLRLLERLRELRMAVSAVIVNAVIAPGAPRCRRCAREAGRQRREIGALRSQSSPRLPTGNPLILTPETAPPPRGVRELRRWGVRWMRPDASPGGRAR
jgi:arsenite-transporting ATPase